MRTITCTHFWGFGEGLGLNARQIEGTFNRQLRHKEPAMELIKVSFLSDGYKQKYMNLLTERYDRIAE